jgi:hypothetical protein
MPHHGSGSRLWICNWARSDSSDGLVIRVLKLFPSREYLLASMMALGQSYAYKHSKARQDKSRPRFDKRDMALLLDGISIILTICER